MLAMLSLEVLWSSREVSLLQLKEVLGDMGELLEVREATAVRVIQCVIP